MHFNPSLFLVYIVGGYLLGNLTSAEPLMGTAVSEAVNGKYPFMVSIAKRIDNIPAELMHICTGSLIANNFVLTAAHCIENLTAESIRLIVGKVDLRDGIWYNASMLITYNQWANSKNISKKYSANDIGIIKLSDKVRAQVAKPVVLSYKKIGDLKDELVVLVGWGTLSENTEIPSRFLQEAKVRILFREACQDNLFDLCKKRISINEKYICTKGEPSVTVTHGDSGGPVLRKNSLLAINVLVFVEPLCNSTVPDNSLLNRNSVNVHLGIDFYREFIIDVMKS